MTMHTIAQGEPRGLRLIDLVPVTNVNAQVGQTCEVPFIDSQKGFYYSG
jgi:hypothetical protein